MADSRDYGTASRASEDLVDAAGALGASVARLGIAAVGWPLYLLPPRVRHDAIDATTDLFSAVGALHMSFARAAIRGVQAATRELNRVVDEQSEPAEPRP